ncbi:glycoside hydrolase [Halomonas sp. 1513]|nr:NlpC/P60 family protein [Halomonas sp. 1513]APX93971.1 glycoside hydrolase [Halomonas sp. 1513]
MLRIAGVCLLLGIVAGCAGTPQEEPPAEYFGTSLPSLDRDPLMSPVDNPTRELRSFQRPSPALVRQALLAQHERWVGTPYRLGGEGQAGIDCSALMQHVFNDSFRMDLPRTTESQALQGSRIERSELRPGDLVFFRPPGPYNHVGVYVGDGYFLHASTSQGVILSEIDNTYWQRHYWQSRRPMDQTQLAQRAAWTQRG